MTFALVVRDGAAEGFIEARAASPAASPAAESRAAGDLTAGGLKDTLRFLHIARRPHVCPTDFVRGRCVPRARRV
jgi:hypothetical protein